MSKYKSKLNLRDTQIAIKLLKDTFEDKLAEALNLYRVSAPIFVLASSKLNDELGETNKCVSFTTNNIKDDSIEIVQSLAKWKRTALSKYGFNTYEGIYTDMNAIRRNETMDNLHSIYVDQWDWEKIILNKDRTLNYLYSTVNLIISALKETEDILLNSYPTLERTISNNKCFFITSQELLNKYPDISPNEERETKICKEHKIVFVSKIGFPLSDGKPYGIRSSDYDDFNLNGDLLVYSSTLNKAVEISSMGIRVDSKSLKEQLSFSNELNKLNYKYYQDIISNKLPLTIGGGIGQSRLCLLMLNKMHIGEVQASLWDEKNIEYCKENNIELL